MTDPNVQQTVATNALDNKTDTTALMTACDHGHYGVVQELLATGKIQINEQDYRGMSALHMAAQQGHDKIVELLIKYGVEINATTEHGTTALFDAVDNGHLHIVKILLNNNADANLSSDNESPLIQACTHGHHEIVRLLLKVSNIKINQKRKTDGATSLLVACREGATKCVRYLLTNNSIFINESKMNGRSPLFIASFFGHNEIVEMLMQHSHQMVKQKINHGILDVNQPDSKGFTPLFVAAQNGHAKIVNLLLKNNAKINSPEEEGHTPLWISSLRGHVEVVRILLSYPDIDIDYTDLNMVTALWAACQNGNSEVVELLLNPPSNIDNHKSESHNSKYSKQKPLIRDYAEKKGADPNLAKSDGCTPSWIAASRGHSECIRILINYGADLEKADSSQGATPLFVACQNGKEQAVEILLAANVDANAVRSGDGTTPLMMAAHNGHTSIVNMLLNSGADPMQLNTTGLTALDCAAMQGFSNIVKLIYEHLLHNVKNQKEIDDFVNNGDSINGWTAFHLACMGGHEDVIKYLINIVKVDTLKKDNENKSGLEHAWQNGHQSIVSWLSELHPHQLHEGFVM